MGGCVCVCSDVFSTVMILGWCYEVSYEEANK